MTRLGTLELFRRGKVRDTWIVGDDLLMVASDRISAFDVVLPSVVPGKGIVLTQLSRFWFDRLRHIVPNHLISADLAAVADRLPESVANDPESRRKVDAGPPGRSNRRRVRRPRLPVWFGLVGVPVPVGRSPGSGYRRA